MDTPITTPAAAPTTAPDTGSNVPEGMSGGGDLPSAKSVTREFESSQSPELFEVKVNGRIQKMTRQEVIDHASMSYAANQKFNEAKQQRSDYERLTGLAKKNPMQALLDPALGLSKDQIRSAMEEWYNKEFIEPETLSPEQRQLKDYESKLKHYEAMEKEAKERQEKEQLEKLTNNQREYLQKQIIGALEQSGLPKTKFFASRMAFYMQQNLKNGWEAPIDMIVNQVKADRKSMLQDMSSNSDARQIIDMLGEDVVNKIRKYDLEQIRSKRSGNSSTFSKPESHDNKQDTRSVNQRLRDIRMGKF